MDTNILITLFLLLIFPGEFLHIVCFFDVFIIHLCTPLTTCEPTRPSTYRKSVISAFRISSSARIQAADRPINVLEATREVNEDIN